MRFTRIRLENWRNFSAVDIRIQNRLFVVGANASGKSNFLDALQFLQELVTPGGGFQKSISRRGGVSSIRNLAARGQNTDVVIDVELSEGSELLWRYRLAFNAKNQRSIPFVVEEKVTRGVERQVLIQRPNRDDESDPERLTQTVIEQTFANQSFRVIADFFASIHYSHLVPQLIREPERYTVQETDPFGSDFLERIAATRSNSQKVRLRRIEKALQIAIPQLSDLQLERDKRGVPHLRAKYAHWRQSGKWQNENDFSDGTLRLIGLLWALQDGAGPLLLEEPELSLHSAIVGGIPSMIQSVLRDRKEKIRQVFISTHSVELLSDESIDASELLVLQPSSEGTQAYLGADIEEIRSLLAAGLSAAEVVLPRTAPSNVGQLSLFAK